MKLSGILAAVICGILFMACNKSDDEGNNNNVTNLSEKHKMLVNAKWRLSAYTAFATLNGQDTTADLFNEKEDCEKDDIINFGADGIVVKDENRNICPNTSQLSEFTYKLLDNDTKVAIYDSNPDTLDLEVTSSQLKLIKTIPNSSGIPVTYTETYNKID